MDTQTTEYRTQPLLHQIVYEKLGGVTKTAKRCGIRTSAVYNWFWRGISPGAALQLEELFKVPGLALELIREAKELQNENG